MSYIVEGEFAEEVGVVVGIGQSKLSSNSTTRTDKKRRAKGVKRRHFANSCLDDLRIGRNSNIV